MGKADPHSGALCRRCLLPHIVPRWPRRHPRPAQGETAVQFCSVAANDNFPFDGADDPSFFSARHLGGPVTWGVCRADVRRTISQGDWMIFFSFTPTEDPSVPPIAYRFVAAFKVERKITQAAIFQDDDNKLFRSYLNLLVRPKDRGWEHFEPCLPPRKWHSDWLWRTCKTHAFSKDELEEAGKQHKAGNPLTAKGNVVSFEENYVIFSESELIVARNPPLVATYLGGNVREIWKRDERSDAIRRATLGNSNRGLRTTNIWQPHRHFHWWAGDDSWVNSLRKTLQA